MYNIINPPNNNNNKSLFKIHLWNLVNVHSPSQISPVIKVSSMIHPNQKCPFLTTALPVVSALHAACLSSLILLSSSLVHSLRPRATIAPSPIMEVLSKSTEILALTIADDSLFLRRLTVALC